MRGWFRLGHNRDAQGWRGWSDVGGGTLHVALDLVRLWAAWAAEF